jgi:NADH-quinone oxidoreductase subunit C
MTTILAPRDIAQKLNENYPTTVVDVTDTAILVDSKSLPAVMEYLKKTAGLDFNYLTMVAAVDYYQQFEVVYNLVSMIHNHSLVIKTHCDREKAVIPSVVSVWRSADLQEREIFDLMGITFEGHPNLKRIVLWPEFQGHPQRRDYLR